MENEIEKSASYNEEDEISLIELFAVLLRYRKFIVITSLATSFLTAMWLYVIKPRMNPDSAFLPITVTCPARAYDMPSGVAAAVLSETGGRNVRDQAVDFLRDPLVQAQVHREVPVLMNREYMEKMTENEYNTFIAENVCNDEKSKGQSNKNLIDVKGGLPGTIVFTFNVPKSKAAFTDEYVKRAVDYANTEIDERYTKHILQKEKDTKDQIELLKEVGNSDAAQGRLGAYQDRLKEFTNYKNGWTGRYISYDPEKSFSITKHTGIAGTGGGRSKKVIFVFLATFFACVFISFAMHVAKNIKEDPKSSKIIKDAWEAGK